MIPAFAQFGALPALDQAVAVQRGLPPEFLDEAALKVDLDERELRTVLGLAAAQDTASGVTKGRFSTVDSERLARLAQLWYEAYVLYETESGTRDCLTSIVPILGDAPIRLLSTLEGFERAQRSLRQLAYGVLA